MPGVSSTTATRRRTSRLKSVLFPTLGRPTITTTGSFVGMGSFQGTRRVDAFVDHREPCPAWSTRRRPYRLRHSEQLFIGPAVRSRASACESRIVKSETLPRGGAVRGGYLLLGLAC